MDLKSACTLLLLLLSRVRASTAVTASANVDDPELPHCSTPPVHSTNEVTPTKQRDRVGCLALQRPWAQPRHTSYRDKPVP